MTFTLRTKISGLALLAGVLPVLVLVLLVTTEQRNVGKEVTTEMNLLSQQITRRTTLDIWNMCRLAHETVLRQVQAAIKGLREQLAGRGPVQLAASAPVTWEVKNQATGATSSVSLPKLMFGTVWLGQNADPKTPTPVVDEIGRLAGASVTVFQKMNEEGDMLRVATNVEAAGRARTLGTCLPARGADGSLNPILAKVLQGQPYCGLSVVNDVTYVAAYEPLNDERGQLVGMLGVGVPLDGMKLLRSAILETKVGRDGYVYVLKGSGAQRGTYVISAGGQQDGTNIWDRTDDQGRSFIQNIVNKAVPLKAGEVEYERYPWKNPGETAARVKVAAFSYFEPWDWVVAAGMYEDDFHVATAKVERSLSQLLWNAVLGGGAMLVVVVLVALWMSRRIIQPIRRIIAVAQTVAQGDLQAAEGMLGKEGLGAGEAEAANAPQDETGLLTRAIRQMTKNLNALVSQVKHSSVNLLSSSTEISATARQQETTVNDLGTSTNEIAAAVKEISATAQELVKTMSQVTSVAGETAGLAGTGRQGLAEMETRMRELGEATRSICAKLAAINEKATNISTIMTTINKVADQTNLLSLNAAIEAEKAGEHGLGFSVVAREIRRLADQTAVATLDIEQVVKDMQSAVSSGVMEMDKFTDAMRRGVEEAAKINAQLGKIIAQVQELMPRFAQVQEGMQSQSQGAQQINQAMVQLAQGTREVLSSLREFNKATESMNDAVRGLKDEVLRFKVNG